MYAEDILKYLENNKKGVDNISSESKDTPLCGVYVFYIKLKKEISTYDDLSTYWETNKSNESIPYIPKIIKERFQPLKIGISTCFYVGKSRNLLHRIQQHISQQTKETTYGLKISKHDRLHEISTFKYSYYVIKDKFDDKKKDAMEFLLVTLEKYLRGKLKPLIGKQ
jgi:hypothetical protein